MAHHGILSTVQRALPGSRFNVSSFSGVERRAWGTRGLSSPNKKTGARVSFLPLKDLVFL